MIFFVPLWLGIIIWIAYAIISSVNSNMQRRVIRETVICGRCGRFTSVDNTLCSCGNLLFLNCVDCGARFPGGNEFCPNGHARGMWVCVQCQLVVSPDTKVCTSCGHQTFAFYRFAQL